MTPEEYREIVRVYNEWNGLDKLNLQVKRILKEIDNEEQNKVNPQWAQILQSRLSKLA